ncbi:uncharacterized protein LOC131974130 [Centropristis striata]|uniref:uncharacterized protein LOC131974130 n=1 Tax=Centropristis striata TaxID=184440 RepID=UPI0027DEF986|nr:uncharacterized protein LOC131974130 [Centropristis striata]
MKMKLFALASLLVILAFQAEASTCPNGLEVWLINGHGMTGDGLFSPDPYVVLKVGSDSRRSKTIRHTRNPSWWEKFMFNRVNSQMLVIEVWDKDGGIRGADDKIGTCMHIIMPGTLTYQPIECRTNYNGYVKLFYKCP